jgi:hypothetical protein
MLQYEYDINIEGILRSVGSVGEAATLEKILPRCCSSSVLLILLLRFFFLSFLPSPSAFYSSSMQYEYDIDIEGSIRRVGSVGEGEDATLDSEAENMILEFLILFKWDKLSNASAHLTSVHRYVVLAITYTKGFHSTLCFLI